MENSWPPGVVDICVVSAVSSDWTRDVWPKWVDPTYQNPNAVPISDILTNLNNAEIVRLKQEITKLKQELEAARRQDIQDGNLDCHMEDKVTIIKGLAKALGVDLGKVFEGHK